MKRERIYLMAAAAAILILIITASVFVYRLGVLREKQKHLKKEISQREVKIGQLERENQSVRVQNENLSKIIANLEPQIDSIYGIVEQREITILKTKKYGDKAISDYLALPTDEREREFAKLIGRK